MTEKELRALNRRELLEILIAQGKEIDRLEQELHQAQAELDSRRIDAAVSGTMAEAALRLNHVFEDADKAAAQYLENLRLRQQTADEIIAAAQKKADQLLCQTEQECAARRQAAEREIEKCLDDFRLRLRSQQHGIAQTTDNEA